MTTLINPSRRALLGGMAALPALAIAAPSLAAPTIDTAAWERQLAKVRQIKAAYSARSSEEKEWGRLVNQRAKEVDRLIAMPAPTPRALDQKMEIIRETYEDCIIEDHLLASVHADVRRLLST